MPLQAEIKRLAELHALAILDTEPEPSFDRITEFARELFGMPVAMISLIDQNRQWLKSCSGMDVPELPRAVSFCTYAIQSDDIMIVPDMCEDPFFAAHPLVTHDPHVRFYAGAPLITAEGNRLGTMCVVDLQPHHDFDEKKKKQLHDLAQMVIEQIMLQGMTKYIARAADAKYERVTDQQHAIVKGTGLGLAISKRLAETMDGNLSVSSKEGEGSVFTLRMPC